MLSVRTRFWSLESVRRKISLTARNIIPKLTPIIKFAVNAIVSISGMGESVFWGTLKIAIFIAEMSVRVVYKDICCIIVILTNSVLNCLKIISACYIKRFYKTLVWSVKSANNTFLLNKMKKIKKFVFNSIPLKIAKFTKFSKIRNYSV